MPTIFAQALHLEVGLHCMYEYSYEVSAHVPIAFTTFFDCIHYAYRTQMKSSQMNDTSGTQKIAIDTWEVVPDEESQGPFL